MKNPYIFFWAMLLAAFAIYADFLLALFCGGFSLLLFFVLPWFVVFKNKADLLQKARLFCAVLFVSLLLLPTPVAFLRKKSANFVVYCIKKHKKNFICYPKDLDEISPFMFLVSSDCEYEKEDCDNVLLRNSYTKQYYYFPDNEWVHEPDAFERFINSIL
jgi:hypothetical protein